MNPLPPGGEKDFAKDLKTFEQLPGKTKRLELLMEHAEKSSGEERAAADQQIADKTKLVVPAAGAADRSRSEKIPSC